MLLPVPEGGAKAAEVLFHCNPGTWEVDAAGSGLGGHSRLQGEFEACLGYIDKMKGGSVCSLLSMVSREWRGEVR